MKMKTNTETLVQDLRKCGELDLSECFIDGTFIVAKKGGATWENQARQRHEAHGNIRLFWFFSRPARNECFTKRVLRHMKSPLCSTLWSKVSLKSDPNTSSETKPTTATIWMNS